MVREFAEQSAAMRSVVRKYPCVPFLLVGMLGYRIIAPTSSNIKLQDLTAEAAMTIGQALASCLSDNSSVLAGFQQWIELYPFSILVLFTEYEFLRQLALTVAVRKVKRALWGLILRVGLSAFLSVLDMTTDIYSTTMFFNQDREGFAYATMAMVGLNILVQLLVVYGQNRRRGWRVVLLEVVFVLSFLKPAVDAYRVCTGAEFETGALMSPMIEMIVVKSFETVFESVP